MFAILSSNLLLNCVFAFAVTVACIVLLKPIAVKVGLQDLPGGRKQHKQPTPVIGGICMFLGFCFALLTLDHSLQAYRGFLAASALLVFVGVLDDMHELTTKVRFIAQIIAALIMALWSGNIIHSFGDLVFLGSINLGYLAIPVTVFAMVGAINAVNMLDGVDGLLGSTALIQFVLLAYLAHYANLLTLFTLILLIVSVLVAYLIFNFPRKNKDHAKVFMGDAGSMFIGFCLTWFFISLTQTVNAPAAPVTMLWIFAIPLFDTTWLLMKRTLEHSNPLRPGRDHLHHLLKSFGFSDVMISLLVSGLTLVFGLIGIIAAHFKIAQGTQFFVFIGLFLIYCFSIKFSWQQLGKANFCVEG